MLELNCPYDDIPGNWFQPQKRKALFTPAERSFLGVLIHAVGDAYLVFGKVNVTDVIEPEKGLERGKRQGALNKINRKHFDFALCNPSDRPHSARGDRAER